MTFYACGEEMISNDRALSFWKCSNCGKGVCGESNYSLGRGEFHFEKFFETYPVPSKSSAPKFTPDDIASDFYEAKTSLNHGNFKAACMMARSTVETAVVSMGATKGGLKGKIKELADKNIITQSLAEWADEVKEIGNDATHMAERGSSPPTQADAEDAVRFTEMLLMYMFTLPGMIAERRRKDP